MGAGAIIVLEVTGESTLAIAACITRNACPSMGTPNPERVLPWSCPLAGLHVQSAAGHLRVQTLRIHVCVYTSIDWLTEGGCLQMLAACMEYTRDDPFTRAVGGASQGRPWV